jgi:hypothetical protein
MSGHRRPLYVPVRCPADGIVVPQTARLPQGSRIGLAFTSPAILAAACPPGQRWIRLSETVLRALLAPLGVTHIECDSDGEFVAEEP